MKLAPKVTVIVPVYNAEKYLSETIESILKQTFDDFELLLVNHASTDSSFHIMQKYKMQDNRIQVIELNVNKGGPAYARNEGIKLAQGEFIAFIDSDDVWEEKKLEKQIEFFSQNKDIDIVHTLANIINEDGEVVGSFENQRIRNFLKYFISDKRLILYFNFININSLMLRRCVSREFLEDINLIAIEDWYHNICLLTKDKRIFLIEEKLVNYRVHEQALSNRNSDIVYRKIYYMYSLFFLNKEISLFQFLLGNLINTLKLIKRKMEI